MEFTKRAGEVRDLIFRERHSTLSTISKKLAGWPFGSIAPYATTSAGEPIVMISEIAEHTRNLRADARASLLISDSRAIDDPQAGGRATLIGYAMPVPAPFLDDARRRYLELFPNSASYFEAHDFTLFQIKLTEVRYIGGFGDIHWIPREEVIDSFADSVLDPLSAHAQMICDHMNEDHADALIMFAEKLADIQADSARMIHADSVGFDFIAVRGGTHRHVRVAFPEPATSPEGARKAMVNLVRQVRSNKAE